MPKKKYLTFNETTTLDVDDLNGALVDVIAHLQSHLDRCGNEATITIEADGGYGPDAVWQEVEASIHFERKETDEERDARLQAVRDRKAEKARDKKIQRQIEEEMLLDLAKKLGKTIV